MDPDLLKICSVLLIIFTVVIIMRIRFRRLKKRESEFFRTFDNLVSAQRLSLNRQEILKKVLIGYDAARHILIFVKDDGNVFHSKTVFLNQVEGCTIEVVYAGNRFPGNESGKLLTEQQITQINLLLFDPNENQGVTAIPFFNANYNTLPELPELEMKAMEWQRLVFQYRYIGFTKN